MERVLHRVNTLERLQQGIDARFDRIEVDVHARRGELLVTHDPPIGPWAVGPNGVQFSRWPLPMPHWQGRFLPLEELLDRDPPPLFVDLKGDWTETSFGHLSALLEHRDNDLVGSNRWTAFDRCRSIGRRFVYGLPHRAVPAFLERLQNSTKPFGVSMRPALANGGGLLERVRDEGVSVYVWDIKQRELLNQLETAGAAGAIFDEPTWMN